MFAIMTQTGLLEIGKKSLMKSLTGSFKASYEEVHVW